MGKKSIAAKALAFAIMAVMLCGIFNFAALAADPIVIDFSKYENIDDIATAKAGDGEYSLVADGTRFVLMAECVIGYDAADDPDGTSTAGDPNIQLLGFADLGVDATTYKYMRMSIKNESAAPGFEVHYSSPTKGLSVETSITFDITPNSDYKSYIYNVSDAGKKYYPKRPENVEDPDVYPENWNGLIDIFRLDFMYYEESGGHAKQGDKLYVEYIAFFETEQEAKDFVFTPVRGESPTEAAAADAEEGGDSNTGSSEGEEGNNMVMWIIIGAAAVVVIVVVVIILTGKKKK
ncbi:MAG: hypothetical protein FWH48_01480 [Oscillospiraceae bacterium]|nr:hypothetical protein [Oscillospiraceae bacterium]